MGCPGSLQLQVRQVVEKPDRKIVDGCLRLWNQSYCLTEAGLKNL